MFSVRGGERRKFGLEGKSANITKSNGREKRGNIIAKIRIGLIKETK
jgi:hypothetical protein